MNGVNFLLNIPTQKIKLGLTRTKRLLKACNNPEKDIYTIQICGTNGKGSTAAFLTNILYRSSYKVGLYTSPHLVNVNERIQINFNYISNKSINQFILQYQKEINKIKPSFFEIMTVLALWFFKKNKVDIAILETGLGGKLDSVTACRNAIIGFTNIDIDHQEILGETIEEISNEKTKAILNSKQLVFSVQQTKKPHRNIIQQVKNKKCYFKIIKKDQKINPHYMLGKHQIINASLAQGIANKIKKEFTNITNQKIKKGIQETKWPGRFETICSSPQIVYDCAHNGSGIKSFISVCSSFIRQKTFNKKHLICGFEKNKNIVKELKILESFFDTIICTETQTRHSMPCSMLAKLFDSPKATYNKNIKKALLNLKEKTNQRDLICIIGSHFFAPHIRQTINKKFANEQKEY